jgi:hypothetical protein
MAVGFVASATSGSQASVASFNIGTLGTGARAGIVFVATHGTGDLITGVTWNGVAMSRLFRAADTDTEPGSVVAYFLDNVTNGTITVSRTNNAVVTVGYAASISAAGATQVAQTITRVSSTQNTNADTSTTGTGTSGEVAVDDGSPGTNSMRFAAAYSGGATPPLQGTNSTNLQLLDSTALGSRFVRETSAGQGSRNVGFATGTTDDWALVAVAVREAPPAVTGTGAGSGTASTATGTAVETITGTGAGAGSAATASGTGTHELSAPTGTGAGTQAAQTGSGTAVESFTGTGAGAGSASTASGTAVESFTGTGAGTGAASTAAGTAVETMTGTGAGTQAAGAGAGTGIETITGTGAGSGAAATGAGTGSESFTGTGAGTQAAQTASGSGLHLIAVTGTGAGTQARQTASGSGLQMQAVTGTGAGTQAAQTGAGTGSGGVLAAAEAAGVAEPARIYRLPPRPKAVTGTGGGFGAASSGAGSGFVDDDELAVAALLEVA